MRSLTKEEAEAIVIGNLGTYSESAASALIEENCTIGLLSSVTIKLDHRVAIGQCTSE